MSVYANEGVQPSKRPKRSVAPAAIEEVAAHPSVLLLGSALAERAFDDEARCNMISQAAYFRAAQRGFEPGGELDDWLAAEAEVDAQLRGNSERTND